MRQPRLALGGDPDALLRAPRRRHHPTTSPSRSRRWSVVSTWPTLSGQTSPLPRLEVLTRLEAIFGPLAQQSQEGVDAHDPVFFVAY